MEKTVVAPRPNEQSVLNIETKDIAFPNGRTMRLSMSQWHWEMISFLELWNDFFGREHGLLYEFYRKSPNATDETFANALMKLLRDDYNQWLDERPPGEEDPSFPDPRV